MVDADVRTESVRAVFDLGPGVPFASVVEVMAAWSWLADLSLLLHELSIPVAVLTSLDGSPQVWSVTSVIYRNPLETVISAVAGASALLKAAAFIRDYDANKRKGIAEARKLEVEVDRAQSELESLRSADPDTLSHASVERGSYIEGSLLGLISDRNNSLEAVAEFFAALSSEIAGEPESLGPTRNTLAANSAERGDPSNVCICPSMSAIDSSPATSRQLGHRVRTTEMTSPRAR